MRNIRYVIFSLLLIAFVNCNHNRTKIVSSINDTIVDASDTDYVSSYYSFNDVLSLKEIEAMDSLEKIRYYYSLTDSIPDIWRTRDIDATNYVKEISIPTLSKEDVIYLHYKQKINGYNVWIEFKQAYSDLKLGRAILHFSKQGHSFTVYCDVFSDKQLSSDGEANVEGLKTINLSKLKPGAKVYLNYVAPKSNEYLSDSSPFYFKDMDFDGENELVVTNLGFGRQGYYNTYDVFKVFHVSKPQKLKGLPFTNYEDEGYKITNYNVEYEPKTMSILDKRYDGFYAYGYYRYKSIPTSEEKGLKRVFILEEAMNMGFYRPKDHQAKDSINLIQPYKIFKRIHGKMVLTERGIYEQGYYGWNYETIVLEKNNQID